MDLDDYIVFMYQAISQSEDKPKTVGVKPIYFDNVRSDKTTRVLETKINGERYELQICKPLVIKQWWEFWK